MVPKDPYHFKGRVGNKDCHVSGTCHGACNSRKKLVGSRRSVPPFFGGHEVVSIAGRCVRAASMRLTSYFSARAGARCTCLSIFSLHS